MELFSKMTPDKNYISSIMTIIHIMSPYADNNRLEKYRKHIWAIVCAYIKSWDKWVKVAGWSIIEGIVQMTSLQLIFTIHLVECRVEGCWCTHLVQQTCTTTCTTFRSHPHAIDKLHQLAEVVPQFWAETVLTLNYTPFHVKNNLFSLSRPLRFSGHFPGEPGLAGNIYWSKGWWKWWWQLEL